MTGNRTFSAALIVLAIFSAGPALAAKKQRTASTVDAAREECIKQAMDRVNSLGPAATNAEKNASGLDVYRSCAAGKGIR
jgi:hypothetical protein